MPDNRAFLTEMLDTILSHGHAKDDIEWKMNRATYEVMSADLNRDNPFPRAWMTRPTLLGVPVVIVENMETGYIAIQRKAGSA